MSKRYVYLKPDKSKTNRYSLYDANGRDVYKELDASYGVVRKAWEENQAVRYDMDNKRFYRVDMEKYDNQFKSSTVSESVNYDETYIEDIDVKDFVQNKATFLKPPMLIFEDFKWKYLIRNILRAQNVLILGPTGSGKTQLVKWVADALGRRLSVFNLGATQDPRGALIGNTHFEEGVGTKFHQSPFIQAIQRPNEIILLDELSRANPEAFNILMTALDDGQRYIRLDEDIESPVIKIHPTVTFVATANVGVEYSSTRVIDRALKDRFVPIQMEYLTEEQEKELLGKIYEDGDPKMIGLVAKAVGLVREDVNSEEGELEDALSTRHSIEMMGMIEDGFSFEDVLELVVYPNYSTDGGSGSERVYVRQLLQSIIEVWESQNEEVRAVEPIEDSSPKATNYQSIPNF